MCKKMNTLRQFGHTTAPAFPHPDVSRAWDLQNSCGVHASGAHLSGDQLFMTSLLTEKKSAVPHLGLCSPQVSLQKGSQGGPQRQGGVGRWVMGDPNFETSPPNYRKILEKM